MATPIVASTTGKDPTNNFDDSIVYLGITACMSVLLIGICIVYSLRLVAQRFPKFPRIPEPWVYYICGIMIAILLQYGGGTITITKVINTVDESFPDLFFALLLPPIIFESGYSLQTKEFAATFTPALIYAGPGTLIAAFVIGLILFVSGQVRMIYNFTFLDSLLLGTMASATDTVSILATMANNPHSSSSNGSHSNKIIPRYIYSLVYGESVLNDAIALVLFRTLAGYTKWEVTFLSVLAGCGGFFVVFIGSTLIGILVASSAALLFKYGTLRSQMTTNTNDPLLATTAAEVERSLYCVIPFLSYMLAEGLQLSGVVATLFCGILMGKTAQFNVSKNTRKFAAGLFRMLASLFESLVFVYIGIATTQLSKFSLGHTYWSTGIILLISCLIGRAGGISISTWIINRIPTMETIQRASSGIRRPVTPTTIVAAPASSPTMVSSVTVSPISVTSPNFLPLPSSPVAPSRPTVFSRLRQSIRNVPQSFRRWWTTPSSSSLTRSRITKEQSILLWWCGPRGGVSFALAMHAKSYVVTDNVAGDIMPISTLFVAIVSLLLVPPFIFPLAQKLDLLEAPDTESIKNSSDNVSSSSVSPSELKTTLLSGTEPEEITVLSSTYRSEHVPLIDGTKEETQNGSNSTPSYGENVTIDNRTIEENLTEEIKDTDVNHTNTNGSVTTITVTKNSSSPPSPSEIPRHESSVPEEEEEMLPSPTAVMIATAAKVADRMNTFTERAITWLTVQNKEPEEEE